MGKYIDGSGLSHFMGILKGIHQTFVTNVAYDSSTKKITKTINGTSSDVVTLSTVATSGSYNDLSNKPTIPSANSTATNIKMDGTQSAGSLATFAKADHVHPSDTSRVPTTRKVNGKALSADVTLYGTDILCSSETGADSVSDAISALEEGKVDVESGKGLSTNDYTTAEKNKLSGIAAGAEVNQNAFSNVKVGSTTVAADAKTDTLELAGSNVTLTPDATNDKVTIGITASNVTTALGNTAVARATGDASGNAIATTYAKLASPALTGTPTAPTAAAGTNSTQIATTAFVANAVGTATAGALQYKGTVDAESTITGAAYKKGWYYVVSTAGTYVGKVCEVGDMLIAKQDKTSTPANDWDAVQSNIEVLSNSEIDALWAAA